MKIKMNKKGFTLIELLIVIAIIAILAAIAIPQFSAYRIKGFNASAESDARNWKTTEEAGNSSFFSYMNSAGPAAAVIPVAAPAIGPSAGPYVGPMTSATTLAAGSFLQTRFVASRTPYSVVMGAIGIGVGNNVSIFANNTTSADPDVADRAQIYAKHFEGDTVFGIDVDSTAIYWCKNSNTFIKVPLAATPYAPVGDLAQVDDFAGLVNCGGAPIGTWTAL